MRITERKLGGIFEIQLEPQRDERGFFARIYDKKVFEEHGIHCEWVEESQSFSKEKGTIRGLHFQYPPYAEAKLIRLWSGEAFMALVDLRKGCKTFGKCEGVTLMANENMIFVPRGFAVGMCTLTDNCNLHYRMDNYYNPANQDAIRWDDPDLAIAWPIKNPAALSERDLKAKSFQEFVRFKGGLEV